eukprot:TRINITY_DN8853_c0_g1_i1.p1 TRINITY_DN8853_c0_g1~~TRINITY_DN8853_c0_g1_i1.p1  ORF type:complete len:224 (-),score=36.18 TRINITY_DN8853_c0_g1_i1:7-678(-)
MELPTFREGFALAKVKLRNGVNEPLVDYVVTSAAELTERFAADRDLVVKVKANSAEQLGQIVEAAALHPGLRVSALLYKGPEVPDLLTRLAGLWAAPCTITAKTEVKAFKQDYRAANAPRPGNLNKVVINPAACGMKAKIVLGATERDCRVALECVRAHPTVASVKLVRLEIESANMASDLREIATCPHVKKLLCKKCSLSTENKGALECAGATFKKCITPSS